MKLQSSVNSILLKCRVVRFCSTFGAIVCSPRLFASVVRVQLWLGLGACLRQRRRTRNPVPWVGAKVSCLSRVVKVSTGYCCMGGRSLYGLGSWFCVPCIIAYWITWGDISFDGRRLACCSSGASGSLLDIRMMNGLPPSASAVD